MGDMWLVAISLSISVTALLLLLLGIYIEGKEGIRKALKDEEFSKVIFALFVPIWNIVIFSFALYLLFTESIPLLMRLKKEKKTSRKLELRKLNQPYECQTCGVYTRKGYIEMFNKGREGEQLCPHCEQPSDMLIKDLSVTYILPFAKAFKWKDIKKMNKKAEGNAEQQFIEEQNKKHLQALEIKIRNSNKNIS